MKANAPEKIQVHLIKNNCDDWSIEGYSFLNDKQTGMTDYTRTDAFIEKATSYIQQHWVCNTKIIEDFIKYMKGE